MIEPWQSAHFEHFYPDQDKKIAPVEYFDFFKNDTFGLKTLDTLKKWSKHTVPGIEHSDWIRNQKVFDDYILPYLD